MKIKSLLLTALILITIGFQLQAQIEKPIVNDKLIFEEKEGIVAVEAEFFYKQTLTNQ